MLSDPIGEKLEDLQRTLVKQFRAIQSLSALTKKERSFFTQNQGDAIQAVVEEKEAILDQLSLIEDHRRMVVQELAFTLGLHSEATSINELLPHLDASAAEPLQRLSEGIRTLAIQVRDLNCGNQALASARLDWMASLRSYLVDIALPGAGYRPPGRVNYPEEPAALGRAYRA